MNDFAYSVYAVTQYDPTRTIRLRNAFATRFRVQFNNLARSVRVAIVDNTILDRLGSSADKVNFFVDWFDRRVNAGALDTFLTRRMGGITTGSWMNTYIQSAYQRGILRARQELRNNGYRVPTIDESGGVAVVFGSPTHLNVANLLYTRVYNELQGITAFMSQQIGRALSQTLVEGRSNNEIARLLTNIILGPAKLRTQILARTEIVRAFHAAIVQEYRNWGVAGVWVQVEWATAADDRVCEECQTLEGKVFDLDAIEGLIPLHAQCRCVAIPLGVD